MRRKEPKNTLEQDVWAQYGSDALHYQVIVINNRSKRKLCHAQCNDVTGKNITLRSFHDNERLKNLLDSVHNLNLESEQVPLCIQFHYYKGSVCRDFYVRILEMASLGILTN